MRYEVIEDATDGDVWRVEAIDYQGDGAVYVAMFSGPDAEKRAQEYANWKNSARTTERPALSM